MILLRLICIFSILSGSLLAQDARDIVRKSEDHMRGLTHQAELSITTIRPGWSRELRLKTWSKGKDYSMVLIQAPAKEKGIGFLKRKKEIWNWVPSLNRTIKLPPSMMSQSWMGTDFTNDDLVRESSTLDDYTHRMLGDTTIAGKPCYWIELIPTPKAAVVWYRMNLAIDKKDYLTLYAEYYNEDNEIVNIMSVKRTGMMGGRIMPLEMDLVPAGKPGHHTLMQYQSMVFDKEIKDEFFTTRQLSALR